MKPLNMAIISGLVTMKTEKELHLIYYLSTYFIENIFSSSSSLPFHSPSNLPAKAE